MTKLCLSFTMPNELAIALKLKFKFNRKQNW